MLSDPNENEVLWEICGTPGYAVRKLVHLLSIWLIDSPNAGSRGVPETRIQQEMRLVVRAETARRFLAVLTNVEQLVWCCRLRIVDGVESLELRKRRRSDTRKCFEQSVFQWVQLEEHLREW